MAVSHAKARRREAGKTGLVFISMKINGGARFKKNFSWPSFFATSRLRGFA
jgi:hypothetical protein